MAHTIKTSNLSVTLNGAQLVQPTSLSVNAGEAVGIIGLNGAGKSTLMKAIIGLIPHQGFSNISSQSFEDRARLCAWVPQTREIVWDVSVETLLGFTLRNFRDRNELNVNSSDKIHFTIKDALLATNTSKLNNRNIGSLSGGELTSVLIARALVQQTSTIFLDEPLASLDPIQKISVLSLIQELSKTGITVIASLHDIEIAQSYFSRFIGIKAGKVVADGSPNSLLDKKHFKEIFLC
ncbi:MAG: ABC transporter ATP-binding protein [Candidatus Puniceispirillaceae bacterium]